MEEVWLWSLVGLMTVCVVSFVGVGVMMELEDRHKTDLREAMHSMEMSHTNKINRVRDELEKEYINNINAVRDEMNEKEGRFNKEVNKLVNGMLEMESYYKNNIQVAKNEMKDLKGRFKKDLNKAEDDMKLSMLEMERVITNYMNSVTDKMKQTESTFDEKLNILGRNIQDISTETDKNIIQIETLMDEKENVYKKEMSGVREEMFISLMKNEISQSTMRAEFKLSLQKSNNRCMNSIERMKTEIRPAFAAAFTNERAMPLSHGELLKFDSVNLNIGEGYDPATGYFTVPKDGIYFVSCTIRSIENKHISAFLWKNSEKLVLAYGRNWNTGSFGLPVNLQKGDLLFVRHDDGPYIVNEEVHGGSSSFFAATFINNLHSDYKRIYSSAGDIKLNSTLRKFSSETEEKVI